MHDHERDHVGGGSLRPKATRLDDPESALQMRAALSGRLDAVTPRGVLGLQRAAGNAGTAALLEEERSPVHDVISGPGEPLARDVREDMRLQRSHGNHFVARLVGETIQRQPAAGGVAAPSSPTVAAARDEVFDALNSINPIAGFGDFPAAFRILDRLPQADLLVVLTEVKAEGQLDLLSANLPHAFGIDKGRIYDAIKVVQGRPTILTIGTEQVEVTQPGERAEAERIFNDLANTYRVRVASERGIEALNQQYFRVPESVRKQLKTKDWKMKELRALVKALEHFAPILGKARAGSTRSSERRQELTSVSKLRESISENSPKGILDSAARRITDAEYVADSHNLLMFAAGENTQADFPGDNSKQIEATVIHEIAHGLMEYALPDYVGKLDYWTDKWVRSGKAGAEAPITAYGATDPAEDLSEAVKFYFLEPETLKNGRSKPAGTPGNPCPKRFALIDSYVKAWKKPAPSP